MSIQFNLSLVMQWTENFYLLIKSKYYRKITSKYYKNLLLNICRATLILGFLPQELLGTSMYEYYHHDDIQALAECHKNALQSNEKIITRSYGFRTKSNGFIRLQSEWKSFKNPWTKEIDYLIAKNTLLL